MVILAGSGADVTASGVVAIISSVGAIIITIATTIHGKDDRDVVNRLSASTDKSIDVTKTLASNIAEGLNDVRASLDRNFDRQDRSMERILERLDDSS